MNRAVARRLKVAGFAPRTLETGHKFYPHEDNVGWSQASRDHGVTITTYELQNHLQDIKDGYYCPNLADLIEACGEHFKRLFLEQAIWTAESKDPEKRAVAHSPEEAVAQLWLALHEPMQSG